MSDFGVTEAGFRIKTLEDILNEMAQAERTAFGSDFDTSPDDAAGVLNGIFGDQLAQLWEVAQAVWAALAPGSANGSSLDSILQLTGTLRLASEPSTRAVQLNVDASVTLPAGQLVSVGAAGAQWQTTADVTNGGADRTYVDANIESVDNGPIVGNAGTIDTIQTPVAGWSAAAAVDSQSVATFKLANNQTLIVSVDGGPDQTVTFVTGDFVSIAAATAAEVVAKINSATTGMTAAPLSTGAVRVTSDTDGTGSSLQFKGGTANPALGFTQEEVKGFNWSKSAKATSGNAAPYALVNAYALSIAVDGGSPQITTFLTADFVAIGAATAAEVAAKLTSTLTGARAYAAGNKIRVESLTAGDNSSIEIIGGTANAALAFEEKTTLGSTGDATLGRNTETDQEARVRREQLLRIAGSATTEAIRSSVRNVADVEQVFVFENETDATDADGLPPHSVEVIVAGGADADIAAAIFASKAAGIATYGDPITGVTVTVTDSQGFTHDINFSRPTDIDQWIDITVQVDETFGGGDDTLGAELVRDTLKALGSSLKIGDDIIIKRFEAEAFQVAGVIDVPSIKIDDIYPPVNTANEVLAARERGVFSTGRIAVTVTH